MHKGQVYGSSSLYDAQLSHFLFKRKTSNLDSSPKVSPHLLMIQTPMMKRTMKKRMKTKKSGRKK